MEHPEILIELGGVLVGLAILSRLAGRIGLSPIPLYLIAGLAFGKGGVLPLVTAESFIAIGAEVGLILLLFMLGLEYSASELVRTLKTHSSTGVVDFLLNFTPGFMAGLLLADGLVPAIVLGGVTFVSSSGIAAKIVSDSAPRPIKETSTILGVLVMEDLVMVLFLPLVGALLVGGTDISTLLGAAVGIGAVVIAIRAALRIDVGVSRLLFSHSDEALLLTILGLTVLIAGAAELFGISAAVAGLVLGMMLAGPAAEGAQQLIAPLRDLFAAIFFAFVGLSIDPSSIPPVLWAAVLLAVVGAASKFLTGWIAARRGGIGRDGAIRIGTTLIARGEFSIAIAGLATTAGLDPDLEALAVTYVMLLAVGGPIAMRILERGAARSAVPASS